MAIAVIGGLLSSTALSLIYVPAVFTVMDDFDRWARRTFGVFIQTHQPVTANAH
jgi:HAE1 family hydrophobic/amphiphilic exporter-1